MGRFQIVNGDKFGDGLHRHIKEKEERFRQRYGREGGVLPNIKRLWQSLKSEAAETGSGALGHGAALTYPDRPYMHWQFEYEDRAGVGRGGIQDRNNPVTFLEGAQALHAMFREVREFRDVDGADNGRDWGAIADRVKEIIERPGRKAERVGYWQEAAGSGDLHEGPGERIPNYEDHDWNEQREHLAEDLASSSAVFQRPVFQFYQAAAAHRVYVLRDLLPGHGLLGN